MLKHRLIAGPAMFLLLLAVFYLDDRLDLCDLRGTVWQKVFLGRAYLPAGLLLLGAVVVLEILACKELCRIFRAKGIPADRAMVTLASIVGCSMMYVIPYETNSRMTLAIFASCVVAMFLGTLYKHSWITRRTEGAVAVAGVTMLSLIYAGLLPGFLIAIRRWYSAWVVLAVVLIVKSCDIGAYATGRLLGRHKLIPWLSPGKTWEGLLGGILFSSLVAAVLAALTNHFGIAGLYHQQGADRLFIPDDFNIWRSAAAGLLMGAFGQFGDLVASLFKRDAGIKDSGQSIPGFGGVLDVVDSPIVVAPLAYWLLYLGTMW
ncbi:MAG: phosphatidate cytidylyltransferase [Phycisphaeraceae bacterium]|nr:phosphatidate cytidylyltransferase [Phycisphaeraceae bacterium]